MATTLQLANSIAWAAPFLSYRPLTSGQNNEPALSSANTILQTILSPPFTWRWNRKIVPFTTQPDVSDYTVQAADFGYIELATCNGFEMETEGLLAVDGEPARPRFISAVLDDDNGNITFRLTPCHDQAYPVQAIYQKAAPLLLSPVSLWSPIPDWMSFVYNWGFLAMMALYTDDPRSQLFSAKFVSTLLSVSEGLSEEQKAMFAEQWLTMANQIQAGNLRISQGAEARGAI